MHCLKERSAGISVSAAAYCRQIDTITAARSSATLGPVCPWTAVSAATHINAATALANQAQFGAAECARARTGLRHWGAVVRRAAANCVPFATSDHNYVEINLSDAFSWRGSEAVSNKGEQPSPSSVSSRLHALSGYSDTGPPGSRLYRSHWSSQKAPALSQRRMFATFFASLRVPFVQSAPSRVPKTRCA
jgi:hypothetical protein